jgi:hypothetical protein
VLWAELRHCDAAWQTCNPQWLSAKTCVGRGLELGFESPNLHAPSKDDIKVTHNGDGPCCTDVYLISSSGVHILLRPHQTESTHPHSTEALNAGTSPTPDFYSKRNSEPVRHSTLLYTRHAPAPALPSTIPVAHEPHHARATRNTATIPANHIFYKTSHRKKQNFTETRLSYNTARNIHHRALRGHKPRIPLQIVTCHLQIDCKNEISLPII